MRDAARSNANIADVNGDGTQYSMDATVAYKQAALNCMDYIQRLGYTREQARK
jgi:formamidase